MNGNSIPVTIGIDARLWSETGVGRYIRNLVKRLQIIDTSNNYVLFVRSTDYETIKSQTTNLKWKLVITDIRWHTFKEQIKFISLLTKEHLDLMHFPYFSFPMFYRGKFIITIHDLILHHFPTGKASTLPYPFYYLKLHGYKLLMKYGARRAEKIITVSNATKKEIMDHLRVSENKIAVTYEGVDEKVSSNKYQEISKNDQPPFFLYVGNAYPHKNLERLLEAFKKFKEQTQSEVSLLLIGKEDYFYKQIKRKINEMNLNTSIIIKHNVNDETLSKLYHNAIATVIPSFMEGFGLPAIEAMANNCLVIAAAIPSLKEVCKNAAVYFDPYNTNDIAGKLIDVYKNKKGFSNKKEEGRTRLSLFSWETMAKKTLEIYESCISLR